MANESTIRKRIAARKSEEEKARERLFSILERMAKALEDQVEVMKTNNAQTNKAQQAIENTIKSLLGGTEEKITDTVN